MPKAPVELSLKDVYRVCDPSSLGFATTAELPELDPDHRSASRGGFRRLRVGRA